MTSNSGNTSNGWLALSVTLAIQAIASMTLLALPVVATVVGASLGVAASFAGLYIGIVYIGVIAASLAAGALVRRYGPIRVSQGCLLLGATGMALCATGALPAMALGAALLGLGYGPITPASSHLLAHSTPAHRLSLMFSIKQTGVPLGGILAAALTPALCLLIGWRLSLTCMALACVCCAALAQPLRGQLDRDRVPHFPIKLRDLLEPVRLVAREHALKSLAVFGFFFCAVQLCLTTYGVIYLTTELDFGIVAAGLALSACQFAGVIGRVAWGLIADRWLGPMRTLALLALIVSICCVGIGLLQPTTPSALVLALLLVYGATAIGWNGVFLAEISRKSPPGLTGTATGGSAAFMSLGIVMAPPVFALVASNLGSLKIGFIAFGVPMLWCAVRLMAIHQRERGAN